MDINKLKAFMIVAEELNFRKSAERLAMSQPPLTRLISGLEKDLGVRLFERTTRQVHLTGAGVVLLNEGRNILASIDRVEAELRSISKMKRSSLNVAFSATAFLARLPTIIEEFRGRVPKVKLELQQESSHEILRGLKEGAFDVGFVDGITSEKSLESHKVQDEALGVLLPKKHPLAQRSEIEFSELRDETIILHHRREAQEFHDRVCRLIQDLEHKPKIYIKGERENCPILVATGKGVSLTISGAQNLAMHETKFVPLKELFLPVSVFWNPENSIPALKSFLSFVIENRSIRHNKRNECMPILMEPFEEI